MKKIAIVGGGVAGMTAAIIAAKNGAKVTIYEHKDRVGKKILSTGNGRCNYTNEYMTAECFRSDDEAFPWKVMEQFGTEEILAFFSEMGIVPKYRNGYVYPNSDQAAAVLDAFRMECEYRHVEIRTEAKCIDIRPKKRGFCLKTEQGEFQADAVILATGSKAAPVTGSDGSGYALAKKLGHRLVPVLPALVQLRCKESFYKSVSGIRVQAKVTLYIDNKYVADDTGEVQLTNYGISGIPVFQISRFAARGLYEKQSVKAILNFMPEMGQREFTEFLKERIALRPDKTVDEFFVGLFNKKLAELMVRQSRIKNKRAVSTLSNEELQTFVRLIQHFETVITETNSFEQAQICCGGVDTREVDAKTMESKVVPGIFFAGELLDVDGICGGYNISFAVASGVIAGKGACACFESIK